jgi:hypothetical protein
MDKKSKKAMRKAVRARERAAARAAFPLALSQLKSLFDWLDMQLGNDPCDHTLRMTRAWLEQQRLDVQAVVPWLEDNGGYCDCEVLANVEQHVEDALHEA